MLTIAFYLLLVVYFLPKTKLKRILGITGCSLTLLSLIFVFISRIDYDFRFFYYTANFLRYLNPIYWILGWGNRINWLLFAIIRIVVQLVLAFFAVSTTGYGFIKGFLPQNLQDKLQKEVEEEAERKTGTTDEAAAEAQSEKAYKTAAEAEKSSEEAKTGAAGLNAKAGKINRPGVSPALDNLKLNPKSGQIDLFLSAINLIIMAIGCAILGFALGYGMAGENIVVGIVFAVLGLILGPFLWILILHLAFPEIFLAISMVNNAAYSEIARLNKRIDELEKALETKTSAEE